jgi:hypothetical protein
MGAEKCMLGGTLDMIRYGRVQILHNSVSANYKDKNKIIGL